MINLRKQKVCIPGFNLKNKKKYGAGPTVSLANAKNELAKLKTRKLILPMEEAKAELGKGLTRAEPKKAENTNKEEAEDRPAIKLEQVVEDEAKEGLLGVTLPAIPIRPATTLEEEAGGAEERGDGKKEIELPEEQKSYREKKTGSTYASPTVAQDFRAYLVQTGVFQSASQFNQQTLERLTAPERRQVLEMASRWTGIAFEDYNRLQATVQNIFSQGQQYVSGQQALPREKEAEEIRKYKGFAKA